LALTVLFSLGFVWCELENFVALAYASGNRRKLTEAFTRGGTGAECKCTTAKGKKGNICTVCNATFEWEEVLNDKHFVENVCDVALSKDWGIRHPSWKRPYLPLPNEVVQLLKKHNENKFLSAVFFRRCVQAALVFTHPRVHAENCALLSLAMYHSSTPDELTREESSGTGTAAEKLTMQARLKKISSTQVFMDDKILPQFMKILKSLLEEEVCRLCSTAGYLRHPLCLFLLRSSSSAIESNY
jgi:hypothetical protein